MKVIVVSHGSYARGLVDTVQMIAGKQEDLEAFGLESEESVDTLKEKIRQSIEQASGRRDSDPHRYFLWKSV